ncbi:hypothetical protein GCM10010191_32330 [Actinomadura vinacea]|uniref:DUF397 domain-containing protein n=1 Tax=Actinomadura vinacea TaxID=115336 RepID=A0ABN3J1X5_9ACTN
MLFNAETYRYVGQRSTEVKVPDKVMRDCGRSTARGLNYG